MSSRVTFRIVPWFVTLAMTCPVGAQPLVEAVAKRFVATATPSGGAWPVALTPDGRYLLFHSTAPDVMTGQQDANGIEDVFVLDRAGISFPPVPPTPAELISHVPSQPGRTAEVGSYGRAISDDGRFVLVSSLARNLVPLGQDTNQAPDLFLFDRQLGERLIVTRNVTDPSRTAVQGGGSETVAMSGDGRWVIFDSDSDDLLTGFTDHSFGLDAFLFDRTTGVVELVSRAAGQPTTGAGPGGSAPRAVSADGRYVLFDSGGTNLVPGFVPDSSGQVYRFDRVTGTSQLVSAAAGTTTSAPNGYSEGFALSADGRFALFVSVATNLVIGSDGNSVLFDIFLADLTLGTVTLVSHAAAGPTTAGNHESIPKQMSSDGRFVLFESVASDLIVGGTDTNELRDVFQFDRNDGSVRLVSRSPASPLVAAAGVSSPGTLADDGSTVTFWSSASDLTAVDTNGGFDVFRWDRLSGAVTLLSSTVGAPQVAASGCCTVASADNSQVVFGSAAPDLAPLDTNGSLDLFSPGTPQLEVWRTGTVETTRAFGSDIRAATPDGRFFLVRADARTLLDGLTGTTASSALVFDRERRTWDLVSHTHDSATNLPNAAIEPWSVSDDGRYVLFSTIATNVVSGYVGNGTPTDQSLYRYDRVTRQAILVSHAQGQIQHQADGRSTFGRLSADGRFVVFQSWGRNLISNPQGPAQENLFFYDTTTRQTQLVSHLPGQPTSWDLGQSNFGTLSRDGRNLFFSSSVPNLVPGDSNGVTDLFVFDRLTGVNELITRSVTNPGQTASGFHSGGSMTPDGRYVTFGSSSTDLVAGLTDTNGRRDSFQRDRVLGTTILLSHLPGQPLVTGTGETTGGFSTPDGRFVILNYAPTGESSPNTWTSLYDRQTGMATLLSHAAGQPAEPANGRSSAVGLSDYARWVLLKSGSTNLLPGGLALGYESLYLKDTVTGALQLLTGADGLPGWGANAPVFPTTFSRDGNTVTFVSQATNLVPGDVNGEIDGFFYSTAIFTDGFESGDTSRWSLTTPPLR